MDMGMVMATTVITTGGMVIGPPGRYIIPTQEYTVIPITHTGARFDVVSITK